MNGKSVHLEMGNLNKTELQGPKKTEERKAEAETHRRPQETAPATLKRLKRGDDNELERNLRLVKVVTSKQLRLAVETEEERRAKKSKTGE